MDELTKRETVLRKELLQLMQAAKVTNVIRANNKYNIACFNKQICPKINEDYIIAYLRAYVEKTKSDKINIPAMAAFWTENKKDCARQCSGLRIGLASSSEGEGKSKKRKTAPKRRLLGTEDVLLDLDAGKEESEGESGGEE